MCLSQQLTHPPHPLRRWASHSEHLTHCHLQEKCFVFTVARFILIIQAGIRLVVWHRTTLNAPPRLIIQAGNKTGCVSPYHAECPAKVSPCHPNTFLFSMPACHSASVTVRRLNVWCCGTVVQCQCVNVWCSVNVSACQRVNVVGVVLYRCVSVPR